MGSAQATLRIDHRGLYLAGGLVVFALVLGGLSQFMSGPLPGDVALMRLLQSGLGTKPEWAAELSRFFKLPALWATLVVASLVSMLRAGRAGVIWPGLGLLLAQGLDAVLRLWLFVPRPFDEALDGRSSLPSTSGLVLGALCGITLVMRSRTSYGRVATFIALTLLILGVLARVVMQGHWPSQMVASTALGVAAVTIIAAVIKPTLLSTYRL
ncbi:MAG: phosphatase PAP2 family protein [Panacagrimonas sp.]